MIRYLLYKALIGEKLSSIMFDKINRFIRAYDEAKNLVLFGSQKYDAIFERIKYLMNLKSGNQFFFLIITQKVKLIQVMICL